MRVLMVSDFYPPFLGGSFRYVQLLSRSLVTRGHEVIVCSIGNKDLNGVEEDCGVKVIRVSGLIQKVPFLFEDSTMKYPPPIPDVLIIRNLKKIMEKEKPDIVHVHGWLLYSVLKLKKQLHFPLIVTLHDYGYMCPKITFFRDNGLCDKPFTKRCISCAGDVLGFAKSTLAYSGIKSGKDKLQYVDRFIANSSFVKEQNSRFMGIDSKVVFVPNFHDQKNAIPTNSGAFPDDFILFVGSLAPYKGVDVLISAYSKLKTKTKLVLVGAHTPGSSYNSSENVFVIENAPYTQVLEAYSKCKFVVVPSIWPEPFGLVALEAMSFKKPVIASNSGGLSEIVVDGKTGILVPVNNSEKLAEAMHCLLENPSLANEMGTNGFARLKRNYSTSTIIPKIEEVYQNLCSKSH